MGLIVLLAGVCRRLSGSVTLHGRPAGSFSQVMTLCRLQSNYSFTVTLHGGPVRPVVKIKFAYVILRMKFLKTKIIAFSCMCVQHQ